MSILKAARPYAVISNTLAIWHLFLTTLLYFGAIAIGTAFWGNIPVMIIAALMFTGGCIRYFGAQHDCGHYAHFSNRRVNEGVGILLGAFTAHPFYAMQYNHNQHHAHIGNLNERDAHEVLTWTVAEYRAASIWGKLFYRSYRSIPVICFFGPIFIFFFRYRIPKNVSITGWRDVIMQNALMAALWLSVYNIGGLVAFQWFVIANVTAACLGTYMVYVGHNFEDAYWADETDVNLQEASLQGSSVLDLGPVFHFMTYNFAFHDLHHFYVKIPAYHLKACHEAVADQLNPTRLGWRDALGCIQFKLWDEESRQMVRFADLRSPRVLYPAE